MSNIDIDLFTQQSEMRGNNDEIIIEITGLKSLTSFIGLDDTPYYYENGKFFKVDGNKIVYADIEYKDLKGDIQENKELLEQIQSISEEASKKYVEQIVSQIIDVHNADVNAHPYIQNIIEENYNTLDEKIDGININLTKELEELEQDVNDKYNELVQDIDDLTDVVEEGYNQLTQDLANEKLAREQADTTLQNNIDTLSQTVSDNYTTLDTKIDTTATTINQRITDVADELNQTIEENVVALQQEDTALQNQINTHSQTLTSHDERITANSNAIVQEASDREDADNDLQEQIDAIVASSDVKDIVGTKEELDNYDKTKLGDRDIIKVLEDNTQNNASTYYRYVASTTSFTYIGKEGPFYTKSESDDKFVPKTRTINNKDLSADITLAVEDLTNAENYVQFTDYANGSTAGVVRTSGSYAVTVSSNGYIQSQVKNKEQYESLNDNSFISKGTLENIKDDLVSTTIIAGNGIEIDNNKISTNTQFVITEDMFDLEKDATKGVAPYNTGYGYTNITIHTDAGIEWVEGAIYTFVLDTKVATSTYRNVRFRIGEEGDWKPLMDISSAIASGATFFAKGNNITYIYKSTYQENGALHCVYYNTNTTYNIITASELETGTATTSRTVNAKVLTDWNNKKLEDKQDVLTSINAGDNISITKPVGKNLFNKDSAKIIEGWYDSGECVVGEKLGTYTTSTSYYTSAPIEVTPNTTYYVNALGSSDAPSFIFLDKDLNFISGFNNKKTSTRTFTVPDNANIKYLMFPFSISQQDTCQLEIGDTGTEYEPYVSNVKINAVLDDYVKFTDYATSDIAGVIKSYNGYSTAIDDRNGVLYCQTKSATAYNGLSNNAFIGKGTLENIKETLISSVADDKYGAELDYTDTTLSLKNANGEPLSEVTIKSTPDLDGETISLNDDGELQVIGNVLTNGGIQNYWCGSKSDYDAIQNKDPNTLYEVLDEINDIVTEIPTATLDDIGLVKPDGVTISIDNDGTISASNTALLNHNTSNIAHTDLFSAKANVNLNNIPSNYDFITETGLWGDGESGYIKYKSKYMEQWGKVTSNSTGVVEFTMHKPFKDMNYSIFAQIGELGNFFISCFPSTNQKFKLRVQTAQGSNVAVRVMWRAYGYSV